MRFRERGFDHLGNLGSRLADLQGYATLAGFTSERGWADQVPQILRIRQIQAVAALNRAVTLNPSDTTARGRLVATAMTLRRYDLAEPHLKVLAERQYQPSRTHYALGVIAESRGDKSTAAAEYRRSIALDPTFTAAQEALRRIAAK